MLDIFDTLEEERSKDIFDDIESEPVETVFTTPPPIPEGVPTQVTPEQLEQLYQSGELRRPPDWDAVRKRIGLRDEQAGLLGEAEGLATLEKAATVAQEPLIPTGITESAIALSTPALPPGVRRSAAEAASGLTSPVNIGMAAVGGGASAIPRIGGAVARGIAGGFAADIATHMPELGTTAGEASVTGTQEEQQKAIADIGVSALMGGLAGGGALARPRPTIPPRIVEAIAKADAVGLTKSAQALADTVRREPISDRPQQLETVIERGIPDEKAVTIETPAEATPVAEAIPREPARAQGGEEGQVLLTGPEVIKSIVELPDAEAGALRQKPAVEAGMKLTEADVPALEAARDSALKQAVEAAERGDNEAFKAGFGKNIWFSGAIEGARRKGPNYDTFIKEEKAAGQTQPGVAGGVQQQVRATSQDSAGTRAEVPGGVRTTEPVLEPTPTAPIAPEAVSARPARGGIVGERPVGAAEVAPKSQETIKAAAIRAEDGTIYTGKWHPAAYEQLMRTKGITKEQAIKQQQEGQVVDGFVTSEGRFVDRNEAATIASNAKQFRPDKEGDIAFAGGLKGMEAGPGIIEPKPALASAEAKLSEVVNQAIEQSSPTRLGVSPAATMRPMDVVLGAPDLRSISPAVEARWQAAVKGTEGVIEKVKQHADEAWKSMTREYADLPPRQFPAEIDVLRRLRASRNASARTTVDVLKGITHNMGPKQYGVFNRVALLEDLAKDVEAGKYASGKDLPFGYKDTGELTADLNKFRSVAESTPQIKAALQRRQEFMDSLRSTLVERGFLPESILQDPRYFHHQVLMYMAEKNAPAGSRSFRDWFSGWQKKRTGSSQDYNRQYVEAEAEVLSDAFNKIAMQDLQGEMRGIADLTPQLKELHGTEWRQHIPKTHIEWQPRRGNAFYPVQTVAERVMDRYLSGLGDILPAEFKEALAVGGRRQEWVIPKSLAKVLDNIAPRPDTWINRIAAAGVNSWKKYILLNPLRAAKYNLNNLSGDLDFLFAAQPKIFTEFKNSASDMWGFHVKGKSAVGDIKDAIQDGVISSGWRASELPDIARSDYFNWLTGEKPKLVDRYWNWIGKRTDAREDTGRLASYRFAKKEWEAGRPFYGASVPADVNALATPRLKAAKVAREILIDYGRGTEFSNFTRQKLVPFFKWMEGNFVRYQQLIRNLPEQEGAGPRLAGTTAKKAATLTARLGAAYGIVNLWNHTFFPDEEEELGEGRNQLHLILGRDDVGNIQTIRFQGALSDLLGWVGLENLPQDVEDLATGKADVGDKMEDAYEAGISRAVNASQPFAKTAAEIGLGRSFYPNALQPRPVRDKAEHAAGLFSLKPVYQWLAGKPHKPLRQEIANLISYTTDPGEAAYNTTRHMAGEWLEDQGEERANVIPGQRSNALYYYKQALRYKDQETAKKFLDEYNRLGGNREGLTQSIKASAPLSMLGNKRAEFLNSLSPQEQEAARRAEEWYRRVYAP